MKGTGDSEDVGMIQKLAFIYQEETRGQTSNFNKLINRDSERAGQSKVRTGGSSGS